MKEVDTKRELAKCSPTGLPSFVLICLAVGLAACSSIGIEAGRNPTPSVSTSSPVTSPPRQDESSPQSPIRRVDFGNFTYPSLPTEKCSMEQVRLINGRYDDSGLREARSEEGCWSVAVIYADYGDITGDGVEEAMVVLYAEGGGNESRQDVFVYASQGEDPNLLWKFSTGDGADGGL